MAAKYDHPSNLEEEPLADSNNDSEETVSLCDLPVYGYDHGNTEDSEECSMKGGDESFEFFTEEWLKNDKDLNFFPNKDIIFCGNLIIPKIAISRNTHEFKKRNHGSNRVDLNSGSCRKSEFAKFMPMNDRRNQGGKHESTKRVFPESVSVKSRWYYYGVGLAGIPAEMELSAIKSRQQSRQKNNHSVGVGGGGKAESGGLRRGKGLGLGLGLGLGRLVRDLSCDGQSRPNSMVKPSLVYIPRG